MDFDPRLAIYKTKDGPAFDAPQRHRSKAISVGTPGETAPEENLLLGADGITVIGTWPSSSHWISAAAYTT